MKAVRKIATRPPVRKHCGESEESTLIEELDFLADALHVTARGAWDGAELRGSDTEAYQLANALRILAYRARSLAERADNEEQAREAGAKAAE